MPRCTAPRTRTGTCSAQHDDSDVWLPHIHIWLIYGIYTYINNIWIIYIIHDILYVYKVSLRTLSGAAAAASSTLCARCFGRRSRRIAALKIDVEGFENHVIEGGKSFWKVRMMWRGRGWVRKWRVEVKLYI